MHRPFVILAITAVLVIVLSLLFSWLDQPQITTVGPHQVSSFDDRFNAIFPSGNYILENRIYFEIYQGNSVLQSQYQEPDLGETQGKYILNTELQGTWSINGHATIWSTKPTNISFVLEPFKKDIAKLLFIMIGLILSLLLLRILW